MIDELERQLREKNEQNLKQKLQEYKLSLEHQRNQPSQFEHHKRVKSKEYRQDPKAYENYARIMMEKR